MGPMPGLGVLGYFRALHDVRDEDPKLSNTGPAEDVHPATYVFNRMINILKSMHDKNPAWGPLFVEHPGNLTRHFLSYDMGK